MADLLIVEDTKRQADLIAGFVSSNHTIVGRASTSAEAVRLALETVPDVVIMDLNLDDGTGIEATQQIKSSRPETPIIVSTVNVSEELRGRAFEAGADAYLTKPYRAQELKQTILEVL